MDFPFKRPLSYLVLFSFFFQTLWPSVALANLPSKECWDDYQGLTLKVKAIVDKAKGVKGLKVQLTESFPLESEASLLSLGDKKAPLFDKTIWFPSVVSSPAEELYKHLGNLEDQSGWGYCEYEGLGMRVDPWGNVVLMPGLSKSSVTTPPSLRVKTTGMVGIASALSMAQLKVKARQVFGVGEEGRGKTSFIENLEVWATGDAQQAGTFMVMNNANVEVKTLTLYEGHLENHGRFAILSGGLVDLNRQNVSNYQDLVLGRGAKIKNSYTLGNYGSVNGDDYSLSSAILHNDSTGKIEGTKVNLLVQELFANNGFIATQQKTQLVVMGSARNLGTMISQGEQWIAVSQDFYNRGTVWAPQQSLRVLGKTLNEGKIKGQELTLALQDLDNRSLIHAGRRLDGIIAGGQNSGLIRSKGVSFITLNGDFVNERFIQSAQETLFDVAEGVSFKNQGHLTSHQNLTLKGKGHVENRGIVEAQREVSLETTSFDNHHLVKAQTELRIATTSLFHNHQTGFIHSQGQTVFSGEGKVINDAQEVSTGPEGTEELLGIISVGSILFDTFTGSLENNGLLYTLQKIKGHARLFHNHHRIQADQGYDLKLDDFLNTGHWTGGGQLGVVKGKNAGWFSTSKLVMDIQDRFDQEATGTLKVTEGLTFTGPGKVINGGLIHTPSLTVGVETFENTQRLISGEMQVLPSTKKFIQAKDAFMESQILEFQGEGKTAVSHQGNWLVTKGLKGTVASFESAGKFVVQGDATIHTLTVLGNLLTTKESQWEAGGFKLDVKGDWLHEGVLCLRGNSTLTTPLLKNHGQIGRAEGVVGSLELVAGTLENNGSLGFYNLHLTVKDRLTTTLKSNLSAAHRLVLAYDKVYEHYGSLHAKDFTYQGKGYSSKLVNKGTLVATEKTLIKAEFDNTTQGTADLTGLTLKTPYESDNFFNNGKLTLRNVQSLGQKTQHIHNGPQGVLAFLDNGYGVLVDRKLIGKGLTFKGIDNYGTIAFGTGTYWVEEVFRNRESGIEQALKGQDLWCADMINDGLTYAEHGLRVDQTRGVFTKLGKVKVGKEDTKADLILELGPQTSAADYVRENAAHWDISGALHLHVDHFANNQLLGLGFPVFITARNAFENISKIHAKELHIKAQRLRQGRILSTYNEENGCEETKQQLGELKSEGVLTTEVEEDLDNQLGRMEAKGPATLTSLRGRILNGHPIPGANYWHNKNEAVISSGQLLTLKAVEVRNHFGELTGNGGMDITGTQGIHNESGSIRVHGNATVRGPLFYNQRSVPYRDGSGGGWYGSNFDSKFCYVSTGDASQLLVTGNIYFLVDALVNEASHVTSFGFITDKQGHKRTRDNLGYFQHINRLITPQYGAVKGCNPDRGQFFSGGELREEGSFSSATYVDFSFDDNKIVGAKLASAQLQLRGQHLTLTDGGMTKGGGNQTLPRTVRKSLYPALKQLAGGDITRSPQTPHTSTVYQSRTAAPKTVSLEDLTLVATDMAQTLASQANEDQKKVVMDYLSLIFSLQSTFCTTWGRGYIFPKKDADYHVETLLKNAKDLLKGRVALTRQEAEGATLPLITFEEEEVEGEKNVLVPYVTFPASFQNIFLLSPGAVMDADDTIDVEMEKSLTTQSATVHGVNEVRLYTDGERVSETLKDTSVIQQGKTTIIRDTARQQDRVISDRGKVTDQSRGDFLSRGAYRQGAKGVTMGSTQGNTTRLPLELFEQRITHLKSRTPWGTDRTITQQFSNAITDQARIAEGDLVITSGQEPGQRIYEKATQDKAGGDIYYSGHSLLKEALIQVNRTHTQASGMVRQSSSHQETAHKTPTTSTAGGNVILDIVDRVDAAGWHISAHDLEDYARESHFGALVQELKQMRSKAGFQGMGYTAAETSVEHDTMVPTLFNLSGQYKAYARTEADKDGYVLWQGVIANIKGGYRIERRFLEKAVELKVKTTQTVDRTGFGGAVVDCAVDLGNGQNPLEGLGRNLLDSTVAGGVKAYEQGDDDQDRAVAALRTANSAFADIKDMAALLQKREDALKNVLARLATVSVGIQTTSSTSHQTTQVPNQVQMEGDAHVLGSEWDHGQGAKLRTTKRVIAPNLKYFSMSPAVHQETLETSSVHGGVSYNFLTKGIGVELGGVETTSTRIEHDLAGMEAGQSIFIRTEHLNNTGGRGHAPLVDITITDNAHHDTPVDVEKTTTRGAQMGLSSSLSRSHGQAPGVNGRIQDQEVEARRLAAEKSGFTATQQFYYTVGGVSHEISAEMGLKPEDNTDILTFKTQRGETFYHRPMPLSADDSTLYALFSAIPSMAVNPREKIVTKLLDLKADPVIRHLVAQEIIQKIETPKAEFNLEPTDPSPFVTQLRQGKKRLQPAYKALMKAVKAYHAAYPGVWLTPYEILDRDPERKNPAVEAVHLALEPYERVLADIKDWARLEETYEGFIQNFVAKPSYGIFPRPFQQRVKKNQQGVLDALAHLYRLDVILYEPTEAGTLAPVYEAKPILREGETEEATGYHQVNLLLAAQEDEEGVLQPHMDRLEGQREKIQAEQRIIEHHPEEAGEILKKSGIKLVAPLGEVMALMDNLKQLRTALIETFQEEGISLEESVEAADQIHEVEQELKQAQAELKQAEREAAQKLAVRQKLRENPKKTEPSSPSKGDYSHLETLLQLEGQDHDILVDLAVKQQEIVARHQAALESRTWVDKASDICLTGVEVLKDIGQEIKDNPFGFTGALAYEAGDFLTPGGLEAPVEWAKGQRSFTSLLARQSLNIAAEAASGYAIGKGLKAAGKGLGVVKRFATKATTKLEQRWVAKQEAELLLEKIGGAIREKAIPQASKLEYLAPGRVRFDGVEFRAVRDLGHLSEAELREMALKGNAFKDFRGVPIHGHHYQQLSHRHPEGFIVEIPRDRHSYANKIQHPKPAGSGLPVDARLEWEKNLRKNYYKERASTELLRRGIFE